MEKAVNEIWVSRIAGASANGVTGTSSLRTSVTDHTFASAIAAGDIYIANSNLNILGTTNVTNEIFVAQGLAAGSLKLSSPIQTQGIVSVKKETYTPKVNQSKVAGYSLSSTSNDLPRTFAKTYKLAVEVRTDFRMQYSRVFVLHGGAYTYNVASTVTGSALDTANAAFYQQFVTFFNANLVSSKYAVATLVNDGAGSGATKYGIIITALNQPYKIGTPPQILSFDLFFQNTTDVTDAAVITGAPIVANITFSTQTISGNTLTSAAAHGLAIGDQIVFSASTVTGITVGTIYYVLTVPSTTTLTLSTVANGSTLAISGTGVTATANKGGYFRMGSGTYEMVADAEWNVQGWRGQTNFIGFPVNVPIIYATVGGTYTIYTISGYNTRESDLGKQVNCPIVHSICIDSTNSTLITAIETMLAAISTTTGAPYTDNAETITPASGNAD